jgi:hypothetical protein
LAAAAFATAFETAVFVGTPVGFALAARHFEPGTTNSATWFRVSKRLLLSALVSALFWAAGTSVIGGVANVELATPGRVANGLLKTAKEACVASRGKSTVSIPILGSRWRCNESGPPTLVGVIARPQASINYSATDMTVSEDMTYVDFAQLKVSSAASKDRPLVRLTVDSAKLRGFWSLARPVKLGEWGRAIFVSVTATFLSFLIVVWIRLSRSTRIGASLVALFVAVTAWMTLLYLDGRDTLGTSRYGWVPVLSTLVVLVLGWLLRREPKLFYQPFVYRKQLDSTPS